MIRAVAYLRCSDSKQENSIERQRHEIQGRAERDGVRVVRWFIDEGFSGYKLKLAQRPAATELLGWLSQGVHPDDVTVLYAFAQDRLGRNEYENLRVLQACDDAGLETRFLTDPESSDIDTRSVLRSLRASFAASYSRKLSKHVKSGMEDSAKRGEWPYGKPPFGYRDDGSNPGHAGHLVVEPSAAEIVRLVWDFYESGLGDKATAAAMTRRGVPPPGRADLPRERLGSAWTPKHVRRLLTGQVYAGRLTWQGEVVNEAAHEPIIDPERFDRLQALRRHKLRSQKKASPMKMGERGTYTPFLRCSLCGGRMMIQHGRPEVGPFYYCCANHVYNREACRGLTARVDKLDPTLTRAIMRRVVTDDVLLTPSYARRVEVPILAGR